MTDRFRWVPILSLSPPHLKKKAFCLMKWAAFWLLPSGHGSAGLLLLCQRCFTLVSRIIVLFMNCVLVRDTSAHYQHKFTKWQMRTGQWLAHLYLLEIDCTCLGCFAATINPVWGSRECCNLWLETHFCAFDAHVFAYFLFPGFWLMRQGGDSIKAIESSLAVGLDCTMYLWFVDWFL